MKSLQFALLFIIIIISSCKKDDIDTNLNLLAVASAPGTYDVKTLTESDGLRDGPDYLGATVYYPTNAEPPFVSIVIVPGYNTLESSVQDWGPFYASHGIVAMTIGTNSPATDFPDDRADALLDAIESLKAENTRVDSDLNGKLDLGNIAVSGWSMGGGGAQLAAMLDPSIKAVIGLCPWLDDGSVLNHQIPLLIFSGEWDFVAPPNSHANIHYENTPNTTDKLLYELSGEGHFAGNDPARNDGTVGRFALAWLKIYLENDLKYRPLLFDIPDTASKFETNLEE